MNEKSDFVVIKSQDEVRVFVTDGGEVCIERNSYEWEGASNLDSIAVFIAPHNAEALCKAIMAAAAEARQES